MDAVLEAARGRVVTREEANRFELDANRLGYARIIAALAPARPGGVVVHCQAGYGRTGIAVALMLALVGAGDRDVAADYSLSAPTAHESYARWLASQPDVDALEADNLLRQSIATPEAMLDTLTYLRDRYGGAERSLVDAGLRPSDLAALRRRLIDAS